MVNFDEAKEATAEMFENANNEEAVAENNLADDVPAESGDGAQAEPDEASAQEDFETRQNKTLEEAVLLAEQAAAEANQKNEQMRQLMNEMSALSEQNKTLQETLNQMSQQQKQSLVNEAMEMPMLDVNGLAFADEDTIRNAQAEYSQKMAEYVRNSVVQELSPFVEQAKQGMYEKEKAEVIASLSRVPELSGIETMIPRLDRMIANNPTLAAENVPIDEKYVMAYAIAKGADAPAQQKEPTAEEIFAMYESNPAVQEMVEKKRLSSIKNSQQVPPFSASSGAVNAALNIKEKPKTFEEASQRTREMFGLN